MTPRLVLAWCTGATTGLLTGYLVGFLAGDSTRDGLTLARLGRPVPREASIDVQGSAQAIPSQRHTSPGGGIPCTRDTPHEPGHGCQYVHAWAPDGRHDDDCEDQ